MSCARTSVPEQVFDGAKLKIKRAEAHIHNLIEGLHAYLRTDFYRVFVQEHVEEGTSAVSLETIEPIPPSVSLTIGDAVHNLRVALDHLMIGIITAKKGKAGKYVVFPVDESRDQATRTRHEELKQYIPDVFELIVDEIRPFKVPDGDGLVWGLNKLDIADKHRLIVPVVQVTAIPGIYATADNGARVENCTLAVRGGDVIHGFATKGRFKIERHGKPHFDVLFGSSEVFTGQPIVPTLIQLGEATTRVVNILHRYLLGNEWT